MIMLNGKDSFWLQLEVCREYQRSRCTRSDGECKFAHPPTNVEIQSNGRVTACYDSIKGRCQRESCKYMHPPAHLKDQLLINGRNHLALKNALIQQQQQQQQQHQQQQNQQQQQQNFQDSLNHHHQTHHSQLPQHQQQAALFQSAVAAAAVHQQQQQQQQLSHPHNQHTSALQINAHNHHLKQAAGSGYHLSMQQAPHPATLAAIIASSMNPFMTSGAFSHTYANQYAAAVAAAVAATQQQQSPRVMASFANHIPTTGQPQQQQPQETPKLPRSSQVQATNNNTTTTTTNSGPTIMNTQSASNCALATSIQNGQHRNNEPNSPIMSSKLSSTSVTQPPTNSSSKPLHHQTSNSSTIKAPPTHYPTPAAQQAAAAAAAAAVASNPTIQADQLAAAYYMNPAAMAVAAMLGPQVAGANFNPMQSSAYPVTPSVQDPSVHYHQSVMSTLYGLSNATAAATTTTTAVTQLACSPHNSNSELALAVTQQAPISEPVVAATTASAENKQTNSQSSCDKTMISDHDDWSSSGESKKRVKTSNGSQVVAVECNSVADTSHKEREISNDNQSNEYLFKQNGTSGDNESSSSGDSTDEDSSSKKMERSEEGEASDILAQPTNNKRPHLGSISGQTESSSTSAVRSNGVVESSPKPGENSELMKTEYNNNNKIETTTNDCDNERHQVSSAAKQSADNQQQSANGKCYSSGTCADHNHLAAQLSPPSSRQQQQLFSRENITATALSSAPINGNNGVNQLSTPALNHLHNHHMPQPYVMLNCDDLSYDKLPCFENRLNFKQQKQQYLQQQLISGDERHHFKRQSSFQTTPPSPLMLNQNGNGLSSNYNGTGAGRMVAAMVAANVRASPIKLEVCREFLRNSCKRSERNCKFAHPPAHVLMRANSSGSISKRRSCCFPTNNLQAVETTKTMPANLNSYALSEQQYNGDGSDISSGLHTTQSPPSSASEQHFVTVCMDFMKGRCSRSFKCRYLHPAAHLQCQLSQALRTTSAATAAAAAAATTTTTLANSQHLDMA